MKLLPRSWYKNLLKSRRIYTFQSKAYSRNYLYKLKFVPFMAHTVHSTELSIKCRENFWKKIPQ